MKLFDENTGVLRLDDIVMDLPSFQRVIADNVISDEEMCQQTNRLIDLLKQMEQSLDTQALELTTNVICELAVLYEMNSRRN